MTDLREALTALHRQGSLHIMDKGEVCLGCGGNWPCRTTQILAAHPAPQTVDEAQQWCALHVVSQDDPAHDYTAACEEWVEDICGVVDDSTYSCVLLSGHSGKHSPVRCAQSRPDCTCLVGATAPAPPVTVTDAMVERAVKAMDPIVPNRSGDLWEFQHEDGQHQTVTLHEAARAALTAALTEEA